VVLGLPLFPGSSSGPPDSLLLDQREVGARVFANF
jgi:hypothetical protein